MKKITLLFLIFSLLLSNCQQPTTQLTTITINQDGTSPDNLEVFSIAADLHYTLSKTEDTLQLSITEPTILNLKDRNNFDYIYVEPGDQLVVNTAASDKVLLSVQQPSVANEFLVEFAAALETQSETAPIYAIGKYEVDSFLQLVNQKFVPLEKIVIAAENTDKVPPFFKKALRLRFLANKGSDLLSYSNMYNYYNKKMPALTDDFYRELTSVNFNNPSLLAFDEGRRFGNAWATKDVAYTDYPNVGEYLQACYAAIQSTYNHPLFENYYLYDLIYNNVNFGGGIDAASEMIEEFKSTVKNKYLTAKLEETVAPWLPLKAGLAAPDFRGQTRDGQEVALSSLKGKKVYVDVWATWCGPCIQEIPALKALEKEMHNENIQFVSISIDKGRDQQKWLDFIEAEALTGLQLMARGDWQSEIAQAYNIKGIPRFLLIDEAGKIVSANAPRPSADNIKDLLLN